MSMLGPSRIPKTISSTHYYTLARSWRLRNAKEMHSKGFLVKRLRNTGKIFSEVKRSGPKTPFEATIANSGERSLSKTGVHAARRRGLEIRSPSGGSSSRNVCNPQEKKTCLKCRELPKSSPLRNSTPHPIVASSTSVLPTKFFPIAWTTLSNLLGRISPVKLKSYSLQCVNEGRAIRYILSKRTRELL